MLKVMKFGGTSVGTQAAIESLLAIVTLDQAAQKVVVVSAQSGVTNLLLQCLDDTELMERVDDRILGLAMELGVESIVVKPWLAALRKDLQLDLPREEVADRVASYGELISAQLLAAFFSLRGMEAEAVDTRGLVVTDACFGNAAYLLGLTRARLRRSIRPLLERRILPILTGFIGATRQGQTTTLGRGGSDLTATLVGQCLDADCVEIWSDQDGMMTADPRLVTGTRLLASMSYPEAVECANFGAKILCARSLIPAIAAGIPVKVLNTFNPNCSGTTISTQSHGGNFVVTAQSGISAVTVYNPAMIGAVGYLARLFRVFSQQGLSVDIVAASEASVTATVEGLNEVQQSSLVARLSALGEISVRPMRALLAVISPLLQSHALMGDLLGVLKANQIAVDVISFGNSALNLTLVVPEQCVRQALQICHDFMLQFSN